MNGKIVFMLEEPSMKELLENLLPRLFPGLRYQCIKHEGKTDLDKSIRRKLQAWREPDVRFIIVRDNDGADCANVKASILQMCSEAGRDDTLVRLVCQELEGWYIGDLAAVNKAYDCRVNTVKNEKRYAAPDEWLKPSVEMKKIVADFQKLDGARRMGNCLSAYDNKSYSYNVFLSGVRKVAREMGYAEDAQTMA